MPSQVEHRHVKAFYPASVKAVGDPAKGEFEALVSMFGNVDRGGDRVVKGAFAKSIQAWNTKAAANKFLPIYYSHQYGNPGLLLGKGLSMEELEEGLLVKGQLFMGKQAAQDVYEGFQEGVLDQFSFAYDVIQESRTKDGVNDLIELEIIEAGPTPIGMNSDTRLVAVKADQLPDVKAGRVLSSKNETALRTAYETIGEVLKQLESKPEEEAKAEEPPEVKTVEVEELPEVKSEEPDFVALLFASELAVKGAL